MMVTTEREDVTKALKVWEGLGDYLYCVIFPPVTYMILYKKMIGSADLGIPEGGV
jgi:hypothetical protein